MLQFWHLAENPERSGETGKCENFKKYASERDTLIFPELYSMRSIDVRGRSGSESDQGSCGHLWGPSFAHLQRTLQITELRSTPSLY